MPGVPLVHLGMSGSDFSPGSLSPVKQAATHWTCACFVKQLPQSHDDLPGEVNSHEMTSGDEVCLAIRQGTSHLPCHGRGNNVVREPLPEGDSPFDRQLTEREWVARINCQFLREGFGAASFREHLMQ